MRSVGGGSGGSGVLLVARRCRVGEGVGVKDALSAHRSAAGRPNSAVPRVAVSALSLSVVPSPSLPPRPTGPSSVRSIRTRAQHAHTPPPPPVCNNPPHRLLLLLYLHRRRRPRRDLKTIWDIFGERRRRRRRIATREKQRERKKGLFSIFVFA